jgi:carboxypeptidase C (cathepsin A)
LVRAQAPPAASNVTIIKSPADPNITISFKSPPVGTCTTVFVDQKQFTGYVTLPPFTLAPIQQNYTVNTFFWFIEARTNASSAPLTIYLNGGPGSSSMVGLFQETGPCEVIEIAQGELGTEAREWGWDRSSNILYIDQPNQVGLSYDQLTNGSLNLLNSNLIMPPTTVPIGQSASSFLNGTFSSDNFKSTANTTQIAAYAVWHMLQGFLSAFPQYSTSNMTNSTQQPMGINLFTESYGGKYGPVFAKTFEQQNQARLNGTIPRNTIPINLASLGIINGCVDDLVQGRYYPIFANNNTYGIDVYTLAEQETIAGSYLAPGGCQEKIQTCQDAVDLMDPNNYGDVTAVNRVCQDAQQTCNNDVVGPYQQSNRNVYDITQMMPDSFPPSWYLDYLNSADVQQAIGAVVNYTESSGSVLNAFLSTGDYDRGGQISDMAYLLSLGVRVALIYGDRDYICNWLGGEAVSFAIAAQSPSLSSFYRAGYAAIVTNETYVGGAVRQYGNLSFSRIYDAGHLVPAYQPETAFTVFTRIIMGTEISTGEPINLTSYVSQGDANSTFQNKAPDQHPQKCWIRNIEGSCTSDQQDTIKQGQGVIINGVLYAASSDWQAPASSDIAGAGTPGSVPYSMTATSSMQATSGTSVAPSTTTPVPTGVFVATATPSPTSQASTQHSFQRPLLWTTALVILHILY